MTGHQHAGRAVARDVAVLWRLAPDRVVVRRVGAERSGEAARDLLGPAALVWLALDSPATVDEIVARLAELDQHGDAVPATGVEAVDEAVGRLVDGGWLRCR